MWTLWPPIYLLQESLMRPTPGWGHSDLISTLFSVREGTAKPVDLLTIAVPPKYGWNGSNAGRNTQEFGPTTAITTTTFTFTSTTPLTHLPTPATPLGNWRNMGSTIQTHTIAS
ncbi:hypothetical protein BJ085DRAFT_29457 [Dimargaris cristalligena]|uniref:Uncharacterized protein n=1 Tax=Dimargaris cristalligena TaxID=215637 RepID=A0A4Q0A338_9FUNG|nr:hypothetical protein BJ085DRAFT_29457 [Dimargaris cristalligena]|eukprot:RKP39640.1 hypothetical protein BJ085DRAFT_29457 [Dimargaris cristalligena]